MPNSVVKTLTVNGTTYDLKDVDSESYAPKASPALTGTPTAPTASSGTNSTQIATTAFVQSAVSSAIGNVNSFEVSVVQSLPTTNIDPHTIYFISNSGSAGNIYDEYMYVNNNWEKIGTTEVDLSGYITDVQDSKGNSVVSNGVATLPESLEIPTYYVNTYDISTTPTTVYFYKDSQCEEHCSYLVFYDSNISIMRIGFWDGEDHVYHLYSVRLVNWDLRLYQLDGYSSFNADLYTIIVTGSETWNSNAHLNYNSSGNAVSYNDLINKPTIPSTLSGLTDTTITSVSNGQILTYDSATSKWINSLPENDLYIVTITSSQSGNNTIYSADKTETEVETAFQDGKIVCTTDGFIYNGTTFSRTGDFMGSGRRVESYNYDWDSGDEYKLAYDSITIDDSYNYLHKYNTDSYTPTGDYNPATKKYVDDSIIQSDWEEEDNTDNAYILNRPAIRAGEGENSVLIGQIDDDANVATYTIYITGDAGATTYSYTTQDTFSFSYWLYIAKYGNNYYGVMDFGPGINEITFYKTLSSSSAITNEPITLYYSYKKATNLNSYAEGKMTSSFGSHSHAEGYITQALAGQSHSEGMRTVAAGVNSHAEGMTTIAKGIASHAEGTSSFAKANYSHAEGGNTIASSSYQHVQGKYNIEDSNSTYAHIVGNGTTSTRSNAHTLDWSGNAWYAGKVSAGTVANPANPTADNDLATKAYVDTATGEISGNLNNKVDSRAHGANDNEYYSISQGYGDEQYLTLGYLYGGAWGSNQINISPTDITISGLADPVSNYDAANKKYVDDSISDNVFIVTITSTTVNGETTYSSDKTHAQILAAYNAGKICIAKDSMGIIYRLGQVVSTTNLLRFETFYAYNNSSLSGEIVTGRCLTISNSDVITVNSISALSYKTAYEKLVKYSVLGIKNNGFVDGNYSIATEAYSTGDLFTINSPISNNFMLAKATTSIASGATLTENTNYVTTTIEDELILKANVSDVLTKSNITSYTPSGDYNPATKKYVDDATSGITTNLSGLTDTTITTPTDGQLLKYNVTTSKWENVTLSLAIDNGVIQLKEGNTVISSVTLPVYGGEVTEIWNGGSY